MANYPRILSIQSHVVSGYVGNKCVTFPLQLLGFEVDALNSVQFSNHTGYNVIKGQVLNEKDLTDIMDGLRANKLDNYSHLLTGYIGSPAFLKQIISVIKVLKTVNPNLIYVCDPVMGDNNALYVPKEIVPLYKEILVHLADIITPNQFELEILADVKIKNMDDAWRAMSEIQAQGCKTVVLTSTDFGNEHTNVLALASTYYSDGKKCDVSISFPRFKTEFTGAGDLFAALFLAWFYKTNCIKTTMEKVVATMQAVLNATFVFSAGKQEPTFTELRLIHLKKDIENPEVKITAIKL